MPYSIKMYTELGFGLFDISGHGEAAYQITRIIQQWLSDFALLTEQLLNESHSRLIGKGCAVALTAKIDLKNQNFYYAGVGNIGCWLYSRGQIKQYHCKSGSLGNSFPNLKLNQVQLSRGDVLVIASDGLKSKITEGIRQYNFLSDESIAFKLVRELGRPHDDASCLVVRCCYD